MRVLYKEGRQSVELAEHYIRKNLKRVIEAQVNQAIDDLSKELRLKLLPNWGAWWRENQLKPIDRDSGVRNVSLLGSYIAYAEKQECSGFYHPHPPEIDTNAAVELNHLIKQLRASYQLELHRFFPEKNFFTENENNYKALNEIKEKLNAGRKLTEYEVKKKHQLTTYFESRKRKRNRAIRKLASMLIKQSLAKCPDI